MKNLVILSGAGMSAESGISTFRDAGGLWDKYPVEQVATPEGYARNPELVINFYNERRKQLLDVKPNAGHIGLAELEKDFNVTVVTQNVDNLPLVKNVPQKALGYTVTYLGSLTQPFDREGNAIRIRVEKDGRAWESRPRYYFAPWEGKDTLFANPPAIHRRFWGDLYIAHAADPSERMDDPGAVSSNNALRTSHNSHALHTASTYKSAT